VIGELRKNLVASAVFPNPVGVHPGRGAEVEFAAAAADVNTPRPWEVLRRETETAGRERGGQRTVKTGTNDSRSKSGSTQYSRFTKKFSLSTPSCAATLLKIALVEQLCESLAQPFWIGRGVLGWELRVLGLPLPCVPRGVPAALERTGVLPLRVELWKPVRPEIVQGTEVPEKPRGFAPWRSEAALMACDGMPACGEQPAVLAGLPN
jgi:hypothetical protein